MSEDVAIVSGIVPIDARQPAVDGAGPRVAAQVWHASVSGRVTTLEPTGRLPWAVVHLRDTPEYLRQPALLDDIVCLHGGGPKEVQRLRALRRTTHEVTSGAVTVLPRGRAAQWRTLGPIAYTHLVFSPKALDEVVATEFGFSRDRIELNDGVGVRDGLLEQLLVEMVRVVTVENDGMRLYRETLFTAAALRLFHRCADGGPPGERHAAPATRGGLPGWRLRRVVDYVREHRASDIGYDELTAIVGLSRAQFFRAFRQSLGVSPGRYVEQVRIEEAKRALERGLGLEEAATQGGFATVSAMTRSFHRRVGVSPSGYRNWYR